MALSIVEIQKIQREVRQACKKEGCNRGTMKTSIPDVWTDFAEKGNIIKPFKYIDGQKFYFE